MELIFGTTNKSKLRAMQMRLGKDASLGLEILGLGDIGAVDFAIPEIGASPLENARIKALAYFQALQRPVFSCDSGLFIDELEDSRQPGVNVRGIGDYMSDDDAIAYYSALAAEMGGKMTARYKNAVCLILANGEIYEYMGDDISGHRFYMVAKPHHIRNEGFPLDSISVEIASGKYYFDIDDYANKWNPDEIDDGFINFFRRVLGKF
ncbi:MAG: hypothetical protein FWB71_04955 [Defluviitaleaceae bacterium]|nr:hypothetical protein [Defluviitaleaceae bacterium]